MIYSAGIIDPADRLLFGAALGTKSAVHEHRWVMAKHLGRPLHSWELVDHMDGNKQNNNLDNLRIYIKGKNQEGSSPGYGTYYDEWQRAEALVSKIKEAAANLDRRLALVLL